MRKNLGVTLMLVAVVALTSALDSRFLDSFNLQNIARWTGMYGMLTLGELFVIVTGGIDLSLGSIVGLVGSLMPMLLERGIPAPAAIALVLALCAAIGWSHGALISKLRLQPFIVTLCGLFVYRGLARFVTGDETQGFGTGHEGLKALATSSPLGCPLPFLLFLAVAILSSATIRRTVFGRHLLALGGNEEGARLSGVPTNRVLTGAYVISAVLAGFAGVLFAVDLNAIQPSGHGNFYELYAIAGVVLGGCSLRGGTASVYGAVIGTAIVRVLYNAINILGIATQLEFAVIGLVILAGVAGEEAMRRVFRYRKTTMTRSRLRAAPEREPPVS